MMERTRERDDELDRLWENLLLLRAKLNKRTLEKWKRLNPFIENLVDWYDKGSHFGDHITIFDSTTVIGDVVIGDRTWIGPFCSIDGTGGLTIGTHVTISAGCRILTHDTIQSTLSGGRLAYEYSPVSIGDCTFLGVDSVILRGVTVGKHVVIGAKSLVNRDIPDFSMAVGQPARVVGKIVIDEGAVTIRKNECQ